MSRSLKTPRISASLTNSRSPLSVSNSSLKVSQHGWLRSGLANESKILNGNLFTSARPLRKLLALLSHPSPATHYRSSSDHDQELDSLLVGPIPVGVNKFIFEADPPKLSQIPASEILGVTVILLTCSYDGREFVRVGYYVNNEYDSDDLNAEPPAKPIIDRVRRNILAEKPRVTRFAIKWYAGAPAFLQVLDGQLFILNAGTLKTRRLPSFHQISLKPTWLMMTLTNMVQRRSS